MIDDYFEDSYREETRATVFEIKNWKFRKVDFDGVTCIRLHDLPKLEQKDGICPDSICVTTFMLDFLNAQYKYLPNGDYLLSCQIQSPTRLILHYVHLGFEFIDSAEFDYKHSIVTKLELKPLEKK